MLVLVFDEDQDIKETVMKLISNINMNKTLNSCKYCCQQIFSWFNNVCDQNNLSKIKISTLWSLLIDSEITNFIINPIVKFNFITKKWSSLIFDIDTNTMTNNYKIGLYASAINCFYDWDTLQMITFSCLLKIYNIKCLTFDSLEICNFTNLIKYTNVSVSISDKISIDNNDLYQVEDMILKILNINERNSVVNFGIYLSIYILKNLNSIEFKVSKFNDNLSKIIKLLKKPNSYDCIAHYKLGIIWKLINKTN